MISEKSFGQAEDNSKYTFTVPLSASKIEVAKEVEKMYNVKVVSVNTVRRPGKLKKNFMRGGAKGWSYATSPRKSDVKKAVVTLAEGDKIDEFFNL